MLGEEAMEEAPRRLWAKILGEEPLFSCLGLSFEERFGNVCTRVAGAIAPAAGGRRVFSLVRARVPQPRLCMNNTLLMSNK